MIKVTEKIEELLTFSNKREKEEILKEAWRRCQDTTYQEKYNVGPYLWNGRYEEEREEFEWDIVWEIMDEKMEIIIEELDKKYS